MEDNNKKEAMACAGPQLPFSYFPLPSLISWNDNLYAWPIGVPPGPTQPQSAPTPNSPVVEYVLIPLNVSSRIRIWYYNGSTEEYMPLDANFRQIGYPRRTLPLRNGDFWLPSHPRGINTPRYNDEFYYEYLAYDGDLDLLGEYDDGRDNDGNNPTNDNTVDHVSEPNTEGGVIEEIIEAINDLIHKHDNDPPCWSF